MGWRLVLEAGYELARARVMTCLPASAYLAQAQAKRGHPAKPCDLEQAQALGKTVAAVARRMPFRALCLQQALATRRMLRHRGFEPTICLALNTDPAGRAASRHGRAAHAWVRIGESVICGRGLPDRYAIVAQIG